VKILKVGGGLENDDPCRPRSVKPSVAWGNLRRMREPKNGVERERRLARPKLVKERVGLNKKEHHGSVIHPLFLRPKKGERQIPIGDAKGRPKKRIR